MGVGEKMDRTDERIRNELIQYLDGILVERKEEGWLRIREDVYSRKQRTASRTRLRLSVAAVLILVILLTLRTSSVGAWGREFLSSILVRMPGPLRNLVTDFKPLEGQPSEKTKPEGQMKLLFSSITYIPLIVDGDSEEWELVSVGVKSGKTGAKVALEYGNKAGTVLTLEEQPLNGPRSSTVLYDADDTVITEVTVRGLVIEILYHNSGAVNVWWIEHSLVLHLSGQGDADTAFDLIDKLVPYSRKR